MKVNKSVTNRCKALYNVDIGVQSRFKVNRDKTVYSDHANELCTMKCYLKNLSKFWCTAKYLFMIYGRSWVFKTLCPIIQWVSSVTWCPIIQWISSVTWSPIIQWISLVIL